MSDSVSRACCRSSSPKSSASGTMSISWLKRGLYSLGSGRCRRSVRTGSPCNTFSGVNDIIEDSQPVVMAQRLAAARQTGTDPPTNRLALTVVHSAAERQTDAELVMTARHAESAAGDAFGKLVRRYQRMVYALALSLVREADADDVAQEAFLRAFRNLDLLADPARFGVWLRRITFGAAIDHVRAARSRDTRLARPAAYGPGDAWVDDESELPDP